MDELLETFNTPETEPHGTEFISEYKAQVYTYDDIGRYLNTNPHPGYRLVSVLQHPVHGYCFVWQEACK